MEMGAYVFDKIHDVVGGLMSPVLGEACGGVLAVSTFGGWEGEGRVVEMRWCREAARVDACAETLESGNATGRAASGACFEILAVFLLGCRGPCHRRDYAVNVGCVLGWRVLGNVVLHHVTNY